MHKIQASQSFLQYNPKAAYRPTQDKIFVPVSGYTEHAITSQRPVNLPQGLCFIYSNMLSLKQSSTEVTS